MNKEKLKTEFASKMMEIYEDRDTYSRGKIIDMAMETFTEVVNENCNLDIVVGSALYGLFRYDNGGYMGYFTTREAAEKMMAEYDADIWYVSGMVQQD